MSDLMRKWGLVLAIALLGACAPRLCRADLILETTGPPQGTITSGAGDFAAQEFSPGSQSYTLTSIISIAGGSTGTYTGLAELVTNNGGTPAGGTVLTTFTFPTIGAGATSVEFDPNTPVTLVAGTSYWFVLGTISGTGSFTGGYTGTPTVTGPGSIGANGVSTNGGTSYTTSTSGSGFIQVNGTPTAVPEPSPAILTGLAGLIGLGEWLRRRRLARPVGWASPTI